MKAKQIVIALAVLAALGRLFITPRLTAIPTIEGTYEALAHLFVGFLILVPFYDHKDTLGPARMYGWIGWALAIWEAVWFFFQKMGH